MKLKLSLAMGTAFSVLAMSAALANSNTLYIEQIGDTNAASINQSGGAGNNDIGTLTDPVTQQGNLNSFNFSNTASGSGVNNDIIDAEQIGNSNYFSYLTWNVANNNVINKSEQLGNFNQSRITNNGSDSGLIGALLQQGNSNHLLIEQSGSSSNGNQVLSVSMVGDNNGLAPDGNGATRRAGTYIYQSGNSNQIASASLEGSNNIGPAGNSNTYRNVQRIEQRGNSNGLLASVASTIGSGVGADYNRLWVFQTGDSNNFSVQQGVTVASTGNHAVVTQTGNGNMTTGTQLGSYNVITATSIGNNNVVAVSQTLDSNTVVANITGDSNGGGSFSGIAATAAGALTSGQIVQNGYTNQAFLDVLSSNGNQFAFSQLGNNNLVDGTVSGSGNNQAVVVQTGNGNASVFAQTGGANTLAVLQ